MLLNATQSNRQLAVFTPVGEDALLLTKVEGVECISGMFEFQLTMRSASDALPARDIVGQNVTFSIRDQDGSDKWFNGEVCRFSYAGDSQDGGVSKGYIYKATVVPWLWYLTQTSDCRIFQRQTTPQIIEQVFADLGFSDFDTSGLSGSYPVRDYCVQYRETDFNFVSRLMEEEGVHYFFRHHNGRHELVLADNNDVFEDIANASDIELADSDSSGDLQDQLTEWHHEYAFVPGKHSQRDFDFKSPDTDLTRSAKTVLDVVGADNYEVYEYPGRYDQGDNGSRLTDIRMEEAEVRHNIASGAGTYQTFQPGGKFQLKSHRTQAEVGRQYVLTQVKHFAELGGAYTTGTDTVSHEFLYRNEFECIPADVPFRPQRTTIKPVLEGVQTAVVVGPDGEQIFPDKYARVKVQFPWDREGSKDENSSCWLRVSQVHAGNGWGAIDLPRIGEEVIVNFLDGDPDRPIIKGRVYNAEVKVPFGLPGEMTRSGGKSNTHKGSGYNEVTADDTAGAEQIRMNAQYNMDTTIGNNETLKVGVDRTGDIGNNDSLTVGVDSTTDIGNDQTTKVGVDLTYDVANNITITAGTSMTFKCGQSTIKMNQAGVITISGQYVSSLARACNTIVAPLTEISGNEMLNQAGIVCLDLAGVKKTKGEETDLRAPMVDIAGETTIIKGMPLAIGEMGAPVVALPTPPKDGDDAAGGGGGSGSGSGGDGTASEGGGGEQTSPEDGNAESEEKAGIGSPPDKEQGDSDTTQGAEQSEQASNDDATAPETPDDQEGLSSEEQEELREEIEAIKNDPNNVHKEDPTESDQPDKTDSPDKPDDTELERKTGVKAGGGISSGKDGLDANVGVSATIEQEIQKSETDRGPFTTGNSTTVKGEIGSDKDNAYIKGGLEKKVYVGNQLGDELYCKAEGSADTQGEVSGDAGCGIKGALNKNEKIGVYGGKSTDRDFGIIADKECNTDSSGDKTCETKVGISTPIGKIEVSYEKKYPAKHPPVEECEPSNFKQIQAVRDELHSNNNLTQAERERLHAEHARLERQAADEGCP